MKIAAGTVSCEGYEKPEDNDNLLDIYQQILHESSEKNVDLLCLPGGYLRARSRKHKDQLAKSLVEKAKNYKIAIAVGVDIGSGKKSKQQKLKKIRSSNNFSAFAICWSPYEGNKWYCWKQRSIDSEDWRNVPREDEQTYHEQRSLRLRSKKIEILLCGELFNQIIRNNIINRGSDIAAVVDLVHDLCHFRATGSMKILAKSGFTTLCSGHLKRHFGMKFRYDPNVGDGWICNSSRESDILFDGPPWVELKVWDV